MGFGRGCLSWYGLICGFVMFGCGVVWVFVCIVVLVVFKVLVGMIVLWDIVFGLFIVGVVFVGVFVISVIWGVLGMFRGFGVEFFLVIIWLELLMEVVVRVCLLVRCVLMLF